MKRDFLAVWDLSTEELYSIIERALKLKSGEDRNRCPLIGRSIGLLFEKASTRTRVSFETGIYQLGAQAVYMNASELQMGRGETIKDTAKTLSRYLNAIVIRTYEHSRVEDFASHASVPVINGLSNLHHPCQVLADLMTIHEKKGRLKGIRLAYIGDGNNVANSLIEAAAKMGMTIPLGCPVGYQPEQHVVDRARVEATKTGAVIEIGHDPHVAAKEADVIYTDVWISMGRAREHARRLKV